MLNRTENHDVKERSKTQQETPRSKITQSHTPGHPHNGSLTQSMHQNENTKIKLTTTT